jgi:hypothetical protein
MVGFDEHLAVGTRSRLIIERGSSPSGNNKIYSVVQGSFIIMVVAAEDQVHPVLLEKRDKRLPEDPLIPPCSPVLKTGV